MSNFFGKILDYFFFLRPTLFFTAWIVILAGSAGNPQANVTGLFLLYALLLGAAFIQNQLADSETDRLNDKLPHLARGMVTPQGARRLEMLLLAAALVTGFMLGLRELLGAFVFLLITGWAYNLPPLRLKSRPFLGAFSLGAAAWLLFIQGSGWRRPEDPAGLTMTLGVMGLSLLTEIPDRKGDQIAGYNTTAVFLGARATVFLAMVMLFLALGAALWGGETRLLVFALPALLLTLQLLRFPDPDSRRVNLTVRLSLLFLALGLSWEYPWFALLIVLYYFIARAYYRLRLGRNYPSFTE
jgi:4-hydroxybenzoate polyprenyltransferase